MARRGENIYKRKDNRWEGRYIKGYDFRGKVQFGYTDACNLKDVHFHALRHTFATRCVEVGFEIKSLSEILGHASAKVTLDRYVHSSLDVLIYTV